MKPARVAPREKGREGRNVLVLEVIDLVIPLEADLDNDPDNPDTLRLRAENGAYEAQLRGDDPDVEPDGDNPLLLYKFRDVPLGTYDLELLTSRGWITVIDDLRVTGDGVMRGDVSLLDDGFDGGTLGVPEEEWEDDDEGEPGPDPERGDEEEMEIGHDDAAYERDDY
jgi:hypothetical protein